MRSFLILFFSLTTLLIHGQQRQYLSGNWKFRMENSNHLFNATVPGTVHQDLMNVGIINDIYYENNEHKYRWIEERNWEYSTTFSVDENTFNYAVHVLVFEGLDTYADVYLNNQKILSADNMFRTWRVEVQHRLVEGENELRILFHSPVLHHKERVTTAPYQLPAGGEEADVKVSPYTRKAAYHFGWDWAPRIVTSGIWKDVYLESGRGARIAGVNVVTEEMVNDTAYVRFDFDLDLSDNAHIQFLGIRFQGTSHQLDLGSNEHSFSIRKVIPKAKWWWPNGHGEPYLYEDSVELMVNYKTRATQSFKYGIRKIELINEPDSMGTSFFFKVNGKPIFVKGANYVPQDMLLPRVTDHQYRTLLGKAKDANMNMLRVWGGGIYEKDIFYDLCDSLGLMVWQDFMFAGSMYPSDTNFLTNVNKEAEDQITRLRNHPSLAIWCGNNEVEVAWNNWGWQRQYGYSQQDSTEIWNTYQRIFEEIIPNQINELDSSRPYTSSSPISNWGTEENFNHATMHYWGVWHGKQPFENFNTNVGRFMVEYGFQSFPEMSTLRNVMADSSLHLLSKAMQNRQKSYIGNGLIEQHIKTHFWQPRNFEEFVELSQKTQEIALKTAIMAHRSSGGHCMGTLFWQLNDCWPGPSWSVIDYYGKEKVAFETVRELYQRVSLLRDETTVTILSDLNEWKMGDLVVTTERKSGKKKEFVYPYTVRPISSTQIDLLKNGKLVKELKKGKMSRVEML